MEKNYCKFKSNVSLLSEISIYTYEAEKPLVEIINDKKKENNGPAISHKDNATLTAYFRSVLADFDEEISV
jgi:hypothetical protein